MSKNNVYHIENSLTALESFKGLLKGGLDVFYVVALHSNEIKLQGHFNTQLITELKRVFEPELSEQNKEFKLSSSNYLEVSIEYNECHVDITLT